MLRSLLIATLSMLTLSACMLRPEASPAQPSDCAALGTFIEQGNCLEPYFREAARSGNTASALHALDQLMQSGVLDDCHMLAHHFGHVAFEIHGQLGAAIRAGDDRCINGYYHGVVEAAVHQAGSDGHQHARLDISRACSEFRNDATLYDACVHGLGHGFMRRSGHDVMRSLSDCDGLAEGYERDRCTGGVMMENAMQHLHLDDEQYREVAPLGCSDLQLSPEQRSRCYSQIGEIAMFFYRHDLARASAICEAIPPGQEREDCLRGAHAELETAAGARSGRYGTALRRSVPSGIESYPWQWLWNDVEIPYLRVDHQVKMGDEVRESRPIVLFLGAMNPYVLQLWPFGLGFAAYAWWRRRPGAGLAALALAWFAFTYLPFYAATLFGQRISYLFYFLPTLPAVALAGSYFLTYSGLPRLVVGVYLAAVLLGFYGYFPFKPVP